MTQIKNNIGLRLESVSLWTDRREAHNISYPSSAVVAVFGVYLSAQFPCPVGQDISRKRQHFHTASRYASL